MSCCEFLISTAQYQAKYDASNAQWRRNEIIIAGQGELEA